MFSAAEVAELQADAESLMVDTLEAFAPAPAAVVDEMKVRQWTSQYSTRGKVQAGGESGKDSTTRTVRIGGTDRPVLEAGLHIPLSEVVPVPGERGIGWEFVVTAVGPESDPQLVGRRFLVVGVPSKTFATARRLDVVEVSAP